MARKKSLSEATDAELVRELARRNAEKHFREGMTLTEMELSGVSSCTSSCFTQREQARRRAGPAHPSPAPLRRAERSFRPKSDKNPPLWPGCAAGFAALCFSRHEHRLSFGTPASACSM
jgi:hypothetical protein